MTTHTSEQHELCDPLFVRLLRSRSYAIRYLTFSSWLRMALVFTIVTGGLLVAFFGITVRVEAATFTRLTPAAPPTSHPRPQLIPRKTTRR
jgi:cytochrome c oxidase subunit IV